MIHLGNNEINQPNDGSSGGEDDSDLNEEDSEDESVNINFIVAQYKTENRVRSTFKFTLQNAVVFIDGIHYFIKELKA